MNKKYIFSFVLISVSLLFTSCNDTKLAQQLDGIWTGGYNVSYDDGSKEHIKEILKFSFNDNSDNDNGTFTEVLEGKMHISDDDGTMTCNYRSRIEGRYEVLTGDLYLYYNMSTLAVDVDENDIDLNVVMLTGSMTAKEKREVYEVIESGKANIIVGTHALIQEAVNYKDLALVVTDEQHRFGVRQREAISHKGENPHVLVMSATPIPRTLAIIMYGDLDISIIDEMPAGRLSIGNALVDTSYRPNAYDFIEKQVQAGRQAYIICPTVEYSEAVEGENVIEYAEKLESIFPPSIKVAYLHGRMKNDEKNKIMDAFAKNEIQVLVSTTVVEVGVNVPNATVMMVENAERFGLAQLHQLRGRVGRGSEQSYCIFVDGSKDKSKKERLQVLCNSNDGFKIANEDLKLRGPGDFFGVRQSGDYEFRMGDILNDADVLKQAADSYKMLMEGELSITEKEKKVLEDDVVKELSI